MKSIGSCLPASLPNMIPLPGPRVPFAGLLCSCTFPGRLPRFGCSAGVPSEQIGDGLTTLWCPWSPRHRHWRVGLAMPPRRPEQILLLRRDATRRPLIQFLHTPVTVSVMCAHGSGAPMAGAAAILRGLGETNWADPSRLCGPPTDPRILTVRPSPFLPWAGTKCGCVQGAFFGGGHSSRFRALRQWVCSAAPSETAPSAAPSVGRPP